MCVDLKNSLRSTYNNHALERDTVEMPEWKLKNRQGFLQIVKVENKKTLLEIGAGTGKDSKFFSDNGLSVTAVDLSDEMVKLCMEKGIEAYRMDFFELTQLDRKFDAVWAMNCLLHVEKSKLGLVLEEISNVLEPTGLFFMGVYGGEDKEGIWEEDKYNPKRFFSFYTDENIRKVVENYFDIVSFETIEIEGKNLFQAITMRKR